jgi:hypothetical protein
MSFLGKFFAGRTDATKEVPTPGTGDDGPPQPKKQVLPEGGTPQAPQQPKKKFEKPVIRNTDETEESHEGQSHAEVPPQQDHGIDHLGHTDGYPQPSIEEPKEKEIGNLHDSSSQQTTITTPGKPLSFLEKMRLKKEQQALEKSALENSQIHESSQNNEHNDSHPNQLEGEPRVKFGFINKFKHPKETHSDTQSENTATDLPKDEENSHIEEQKPTIESGGSKLPFKFLSKKKDMHQERAEGNESSVHYTPQPNLNDRDTNRAEEIHSHGEIYNQKNSQNDLDLVQSDHNTSEAESKPTPTKPRFGFLNKPKLQVDHDTSMNQAGSQNDGNQIDDPNENTLNLSPVDKDKSFNAQGDLADTLDRYDSGRQTPRTEKRQANEAADFVRMANAGCRHFEAITSGCPV